MKHLNAGLAFAAALSLFSTVAPASAEPLKNIVLVHGAWVDASGWKPVYEILVKEGFRVSMVQEPETSFADDVTAAKRLLDLQDGPTLLVGHSYGGSIITEAGVHPNVAGLVYVAAHAPDVGEDEAALGKKTPSVLGKTEGAIKVTPDKFTYLDPGNSPSCSPPICRASRRSSYPLPGSGRDAGVQHAADGGCVEDQAELGHRRRQRPDHQSGSRALVLRARQEPHHRDPGCKPLGLRVRIRRKWRRSSPVPLAASINRPPADAFCRS